MAVPTAALTARSRGNPRPVAATALRRQPRRAPIACAAAVGPTAESAAVGLSRSGALRYAPRNANASSPPDNVLQGHAAGRAGNRFIACIGHGGLPRLTVSRDCGRTWSRPARVVAPRVRAVRRVAITARERGHIELAYLRSTDQARFDGYITHSTDAPARRPHSWSAAVSGPGAQLADASDEETYGDRRFHSTVAIAPDGTGRVGFHCARTRSCPGGRLGIVGRLKPPARPAPRSDREESA
jgi:hypothetical protein